MKNSRLGGSHGDVVLAIPGSDIKLFFPHGLNCYTLNFTGVLLKRYQFNIDFTNKLFLFK